MTAPDGAWADAQAPENRVRLHVNGRIYEGWQSVRVTAALDTPPREFELRVTDRWEPDGEVWKIGDGDACRVTLGDDALVTGWVDTVIPIIDGGQHHLTVRGVSKAGDLSDCSAIVPGGQFKGYALDAIARALAEPFGIEVVVETDVGRAFADVQIQQGEKGLALIQRLADLRQVLVTDDAEGRLVLTRTSDRRCHDALAVGEDGNCLKAEATFSSVDRFRDYIVKSQAAGQDGAFAAAASEIRGEATDPGVRRYRPLLFVAEGQADGATAAERARYEAKVRAARGASFRATVVGWRQADGSLWEVNRLAACRAPVLHLERELLVSEIVWSIDDGGWVTEMVCLHPDAFTPEPKSEADGTGGGGMWEGVVAIR